MARERKTYYWRLNWLTLGVPENTPLEAQVAKAVLDGFGILAVYGAIESSATGRLFESGVALGFLAATRFINREMMTLSYYRNQFRR